MKILFNDSWEFCEFPLDEKTMFPYESVVLEAGVEAVEVMASDEYEGDPGDFFDDEYEPPEYFSD